MFQNAQEQQKKQDLNNIVNTLKNFYNVQQQPELS